MGGTAQDTFEMVWDMAEVVALLARSEAPSLPGEVARSMVPLLTRMQRRALLCDREELSDMLVAANERVVLRVQA